jgi:predicted double-glycine peptidase
MGPWLETLSVVLLSAVGAAVGHLLGRSRKPYWMLGYLPALVLACAAGAVRVDYRLTFVRPFSWVGAGRREFVLMAVACTLLFGTLLPRLRGVRLRVLVGVLMALSALSFSVVPFLGPALVYGDLLELKTVIDPNGVCLQNTNYTCGPAAAVTALGMLGLQAEEGELAILAHSVPGTGTPADLLCEALEERYGEDGLTCEYRPIESIADLKKAGVVIVSVKYNLFVDHYATVIGITDDWVVVGDPLAGRRRLSYDRFNGMWRHCGIVLRRQAEHGP